MSPSSLPIFQYSLNRENVGRRSVMFLKKTPKRLGPKNLAPICSKFLPLFPSSPATKREDSVGGTTRSLTIGYRLEPWLTVESAVLLLVCCPLLDRGSASDPAIVHWTQLLYMVCSCSSARECCSTSCPCDQLHFTITTVHWTQLLYMVRSWCGSARECCST